MVDILATSTEQIVQGVSIFSALMAGLIVLGGTYLASRFYGFLGVCIYLMIISGIFIALSALFL